MPSSAVVMGSAEPAAAYPVHSDHASRHALLPLTVGAIGVVFGDIGTSPLYAFRDALKLASADGLEREEVLGVLSMALWAVILIVTVKYVLLLMRADNQGEGGVLALLALARQPVKGQPNTGKPATGRAAGIALALGAIGTALFYGDAIITPSLSVLSAVEGLRTLPSIGDGFSENGILLTGMAILVGLFVIQARGTEAVAKLFGPVCIFWFLVIGALGLIHIADDPGILAAFGPWHAVSFVAHHGIMGLFVVGAVFLTVTGAEALTADMGHFGKLPIRIGWLGLVFPALLLNYCGQGAFVLKALAATPAGQPFANQDWFFVMVPESLRLPMVILATLATIIASQAVITGAYSLTQQAIQLGLLPRLKIRQTSAGHAGQIYIPSVNWLLLVGVIALALGFRNSTAMASAYGIAVTGTMVVTCCLAYMVMRRRWGWSIALAACVITPFLAIDLMFFGANILRVVEGGWVPLVVAAGLLVIIWTWLRGRRETALIESDGALPITDIAAMLARRPPQRVEGTAIFLTTDNTLTPHALLHNLKHNHVLHRLNFITTIKVLQTPYADPAMRVEVIPVDANFARVILRYGFMETPHIQQDLGAAKNLVTGADKASYFIGRSNFACSAEVGMPIWQDLLFIALYRNAADPTEWFGLPPNRVIELGAQYVI